MLFNFSFPTIVFKQESAPSGTAGALWYKASTDELFYYSGTSWEVLNAATSLYIYDNILRNSMAILQLKAAASAAAPDYDSIVLDLFSDSSGYSNTIDTGAATTATFSTNKYFNTGNLSTADTTGVTYGSGGTASAKCGMKFETKTACILTKITKTAACDATTAYLLNSSKAVIASASFSGNDAVFNQNLTTSTTYYAAVDSGGSNYSYKQGTPVSYPISKTNINYTIGLDNTGNDLNNYGFNIASVTTDIALEKRIIQTTAQTLPFTPSKYQLYTLNATTGSGSVDFDVSFDNGAHYDTDKTLNTIYDITNAGTELILKINLKTDDSEAGTSESSGYALMIW